MARDCKLSYFFGVWEKNEKIFFWDGPEIAADGLEGAEYVADFRGNCRVNVYIMTC